MGEKKKGEEGISKERNSNRNERKGKEAGVERGVACLQGRYSLH